MLKPTKNETIAQGADSQQNPEQIEINKKNIGQWLKRDLSSAISLLNALYSDPDLLDQITVFMLGRIENQKLKDTHKTE